MKIFGTISWSFAIVTMLILTRVAIFDKQISPAERAILFITAGMIGNAGASVFSTAWGLKERKTFFASLPYVGFAIVAIDLWKENREQPRNP